MVVEDGTLLFIKKNAPTLSMNPAFNVDESADEAKLLFIVRSASMKQKIASS